MFAPNQSKRQHLTRWLLSGLILWMSVSFQGCTTFQPSLGSWAESKTEVLEAWEPQSEESKDLSALPLPDGAIPISVFSFRDQTGQYKPAPANAFSTVVTQGGTAMLMESLAQSGWFIPLEREGLQNLLTERKILRAKHGDDALPPLQGARIVIEGGIIGYDSNIHTGGLGAKYLGTGGDEKYRVDALTVTLRAIDTTKGNVIHSVTVRKMIYAKAVSASVFRFVKFKRLLEVEGGMTQNDPTQIVLKDAIDAAIIRLVVTGLVEQSWRVQDYTALQSPVFAKYATEDQVSRLAALEQAFAKAYKNGSLKHSVPPTPQPPKQAVSPAPAPQQKQASAAPSPSAEQEQSRPIDSAQTAQSTATSTPEEPERPVPQPVEKKRKLVVMVESDDPQTEHSEQASQKPATQSGGEEDNIVAGNYSIQLAAGGSVSALQAFTERWSLNPGNVRYVKVQDHRPGRNKVWYTLQYGSYSDIRDANEALEKMPQDIKLMQPWITQRTKFFDSVAADSSLLQPQAQTGLTVEKQNLGQQ